MVTKSFANEQLAIAYTHLQKSEKELSECADQLFDFLSSLEKQTTDAQQKDRIAHALAKLQIQDIITQRLTKVQNFLISLDKEITLPTDDNFLREFAWEKEVDQNDIDSMFENYKG